MAQVTIPSSGIERLREFRDLVGVKDGVNQTFTLPFGEKAVDIVNGPRVKIWFVGQLLHPDDYTLTESGGVGTGFDTVTFTFIFPLSDDNLFASYFLIES